MTFSSRAFPMFAAAFASAVIIAPAAAQDAKSAFSQRYDDLQKAMLAKDIAALGKIMAPEFEMIDIQDERRDLTAMTARLAQMPSDPAQAPKSTVLSAAITGETAQVRQQQDMRLKRPMADGSIAEYDVSITTEDSWALRGGSWMLTKSVWKDFSVSQNGEVIIHQAK